MTGDLRKRLGLGSGAIRISVLYLGFTAVACAGKRPEFDKTGGGNGGDSGNGGNGGVTADGGPVGGNSGDSGAGGSGGTDPGGNGGTDPGGNGGGSSQGCDPGDSEACWETEDGDALPMAATEEGSCSIGERACRDDGTWGACAGAVGPADMDGCAEGNDDNCNGTVNEECVVVTPPLPQIEAQDPADDATDVDRTPTLEATFDAALNAASVSEDNVTLSCNGEAVAGAVAYDNDVVSFTPDVLLPLLASCTWQITDGVLDDTDRPLEPVAVDFQVRDGQWQTAALMSSDVSSVSAGVAVDDAGAVMSIWDGDGPTPNFVYGNYYNPASGWGGTAQMLAAASSERVSVFSTTGGFSATWRRKNSSLFFSYTRFDKGLGTWSSPQETGEALTNGAVLPKQTAVTSDGGVITAGVGNEATWVSQYNPSTGWTTFTELAPNISHPRGVASRGADSVAAWLTYGAASTERLKYKVLTGTTWGSAVAFDTGGDQDNNAYYQLIGNSSTTAMVWSRPDASTHIIGANLSRGTAAFGAAATVAAAVADLGSIDAAVGENGDLVVAWEAGGTTYARRFDGGTNTWGAATPVSAAGVGTDPIVTVAPNGRALVAWSQVAGITVAWGEPDGTWGTATPLPTNGGGVLYGADTSASGDAAVIYTQGGATTNVYTLVFR